MSRAVTGSTQRFLLGSAGASSEPGEFVMMGFVLHASLSPASMKPATSGSPRFARRRIGQRGDHIPPRFADVARSALRPGDDSQAGAAKGELSVCLSLNLLLLGLRIVFLL